MNALGNASLSPIWSDDISKSIWQKLLINIAINPICSISGVRNGALLENDLWEQSQEVLEESLSVARASGIDIDGSEMQNLLAEVVESTSENRCSMLQDLMAGRRTEIESLCGYVIRMGEGLGIPTPLNSMLMALVKGVEMSSHMD
jgi:2-dehydropantoate 2-reductase